MRLFDATQKSADILIIDDALENRILLASQLKSGRYTILNASSGDEGIAIALEKQPDLILLDVMMPGLDGFEVCRRLKDHALTEHIPIIMITALREVSFRIKGIEAGADEFLSRPHHREELLVRVQSLIQLKRAREHLEQEHKNLQLLYDVTQAMMTHFDVNQLITNIIVHTQSAIDATKGIIMLTNDVGDVTHKILVRATTGTSFGDRVANKVMSHGFAGHIWRYKKAEIIKDTQLDKRWVELEHDTDPAGSAIGVPLSKVNGDILGLMILTHHAPHYFQDSHLALLTSIGGQVTAALENARLFAKVNEERTKLTTILEQSNDAIITTDENSHVVVFNNAAEHMFMIEGVDVIGLPVFSIRQLQPLHMLFRQKSHRNVDFGFDDGRIFSASVSHIPEVGTIAVIQDATERILAEAHRLETERKEKENLREIFGRYISPSLLDHALSDAPEILRRRKRWAVILFADLRNHSQMVAKLLPDQALDVLNSFFDNMTAIVHRYEGTIVDLIGDELEIGFNVSSDQPDAARRALLTAIRMQQRFNELRPFWLAESGTSLGLGIGIDQGDVVIGNVGSSTRMNLAMVGEAVNTAHRLVDLAEDGQIIISEDLHNLLADDLSELDVDFGSLGKLLIKGLEEPLHVLRADLKADMPLPNLGD